MKKIILCLLMVWMFNLNGYTQTLSEIFPKMPNELLLYVDSSKRLDLVDLYKAGRPAQVKNNLNETSSLTSFSENYLVLKNENSTIELILLPMINDSHLVCLIHTVCVPVCDSKLSFFTVDWKELDYSAFITPVKPGWFFKEEPKSQPDEFHAADLALKNINLMQFSFDKDKMELTQTYNTPQYLSREDQEKLKSYLKTEPKVFRWKQTRFE